MFTFQTAVAAYLSSEYLLLLVFARQHIYSLILTRYTAMRSQKAVTAYLSSKQLLPFCFAKQYRADNDRDSSVKALYVL